SPDERRTGGAHRRPEGAIRIGPVVRGAGARTMGEGEQMKKLGRTILFVSALAARMALVFGSSTRTASATDPPHPTDCTWTVHKTASIDGNPSHTITTLDLDLNQTITVTYQIVVTRHCTTPFDPAGEGGSADIVDSYAGTLAFHLFGDNTSG